MNNVLKAKIANDVFTMEAEAKARSYDMRLGGRTHVCQIDGQAHYMPGKNVEEYLSYYDANEEYMGEDYEDNMERAIRAVVAEIMGKNLEGQILKVDEEQRIIYGWASVATFKGEALVDRQGDIIGMDTLEKAVNEFMEHVRVGKTMHVGEQTGVVIHSMPVSKQICDALGFQCDQEGWIVGYKVYDDEVWKMVKSGELRAFSIGGRAVSEVADG